MKSFSKILKLIIIILFFIFLTYIVGIAFFTIISSLFKGSKILLELVVVLGIIAVPVLITLFLLSRTKNKGYIFEDKNLPNYNDIPYYRDIPFEGNLFKSYALLLKFDIIKRGQNLIATILLDWYKKGFISFIDIDKNFLNIKHSSFAIQFKDNLHFDTEIEENLFKILMSASGENNILEEYELTKYCQEKPYDLDIWFWNARLYGEKLLIDDDIFIKQTEKKDPVIIVTKKANEKVIQLMGLNKFLLEYSMISDKETTEITLWEQYLIFAQLLGIADKVKQQVKNLNLDFGVYSDININFFNILNSIKN